MTNERSGAPIDLRSDTVTHPTPAMQRAAELLGKEAGLFVASGTQGNLVSQLAHLGRGYETIGGATCHIVTWEQAGHAAVVGAAVRQLQEKPDGTFDLHDLEEAFRDPTDQHQPITGMVAIENTHATSMGRPLTLDYTRTVADIAHRHGVPLHVDGARFFNATVALGVKPVELAGPADSLTFCLSKGLSCPVGSVIVGSKEFIARALRGRKIVGGGMRQAGILAAAGLVALSDGPDGMIERLAEDHANARRLAEGLADLDGVTSPGWIAQPTEGRLDPGRVATNFVFFKVPGAPDRFVTALQTKGVLMLAYSHGWIRAVTHYGIEAADIDRTIAACAAVLRETSAAEMAVDAARER